MKKLLVLVLALILCFTACAEEYVTYPACGGRFTISVPGNYVVVDGAAIIELASSEEGRAALAELGLDPSSLDSLDLSAFEYIFDDKDDGGNLNMTVAHTGLSMALLKLAVKQMDSTFSAQYQAMGIPEESLYPMGIVTFGANEFYGFAIDLEVIVMYQFITADAEGNMYTFTFTNFDSGAAEAILTSFALA